MSFRFVLPSRSRTVLLFALLLTAGLIANGCGSTSATRAPDRPEGFPDHSAQQIRALINDSGDSLQSFSAKARVTVRTPDQNRSFNAEMRQRRADSLYMRFSLFGVEGGRLLLSPDSVFFYDSRNRTLRTGPIADAQEILPAPVASGEIFENMLGLIAPSDNVNWTVETDSSDYFLTDADSQTRMLVDPMQWRVVRFTRENENGTVVDERLFTDFKDVDGRRIPHRVIFRRPADNLMAMIRYEDVTLNPGSLSFDLDVPSSAPRKPLR